MVFKSAANDTCKQITLEMLQSATYKDVTFGEITMKDGQYVGNEENGQKADLRWAAWGDLNSDGCNDVIVILFSYAGGNDPDESICAVLNDSGKPGRIICQPLNAYASDSITIIGGVVSIKMWVHQEGDGRWPSKSEVWRFVVEGSEIKRLR